MRKINACVVLSLLLTAGCAMPGDKATVGWEFHVLKPPTINTESPVLVQAAQTTVGAHPMGTVSGPVTDGAFNHAPTAPSQPMPKASARRYQVIPAEIDSDCAPRGALTCDEWMKIMSQMQSQRIKMQE